MLGAGRNQMPIAAMSAAQGGHVRVGLEDSWGRARQARGEQRGAGARAADLEALGLEVATPDDAREILGLKGKAATSIG